MRTVERFLPYPVTTKRSALMIIAKIETESRHVTLIQNCPAFVPQMVLAPTNPGEMILMWFVVGFSFYCRFPIRKFMQEFTKVGLQL